MDDERVGEADPVPAGGSTGRRGPHDRGRHLVRGGGEGRLDSSGGGHSAREGGIRTIQVWGEVTGVGGERAGYRTGLHDGDGDHEIDLIGERPDRRVVAIEVKLGAVADDRDIRHLRWLSERLGDDLLDGVVVTTGTEAYRRPDGIAVVPAALLGP